ncbi:glycosyltransferase family 2 protein [Vibrio rotiferianus]|uniref:glycosyltransferase family 2 protein n=1 Tax=Vibrio rotiferianus TaxID=190895 RepID=UPI00390C3B99
MKDKLGCVIVTYNPQEQLLDNVREIMNSIDKLVIVDNTEYRSPIINILSETYPSSRFLVLWNNCNDGIAKALNDGCLHLLNNGFDVALLLDQDSYVDNESIKSLYSLMKVEHKAVITSPQICTKNFSKQPLYITYDGGVFIKRKGVYSKPLPVLFNITSGSLLCLNKWKDLGAFDERLFIELVDTEYGLRANKEGYKVIIDSNSQLVQEYGDLSKKKFFGVTFFPTNHSPLRYYYLTRNRFILYREYLGCYPGYVLWDLVSMAKNIFVILFLECNRMQKLSYMIKGFKDFLLHRTGKL